MKHDSRYHSIQTSLKKLLAAIPFPCAVHAELLSGEDPRVIYSQNANLVFGAASIIKLPLLVCVGELVETGALAWDQPVVLTVPAPHGTGLLEFLDCSRPWTIRDLGVLMMGTSDNMACNQLLEVVGISRANEILRGLGYTATVVRRRMMDREKLALGVDNTVTALETADILSRLHAGRLVSAEASAEILKYLHMNQLRDLIAWPLPGSALLAGKTGGMPGSLLDAELISTPGGSTYSLCVFTSGFERALQAKRLINEISEQLYTAVSGSRGEGCD